MSERARVDKHAHTKDKNAGNSQRKVLTNYEGLREET